jgi:hypothetical protein
VEDFAVRLRRMVIGVVLAAAATVVAPESADAQFANRGGFGPRALGRAIIAPPIARPRIDRGRVVNRVRPRPRVIAQPLDTWARRPRPSRDVVQVPPRRPVRDKPVVVVVEKPPRPPKPRAERPRRPRPPVIVVVPTPPVVAHPVLPPAVRRPPSLVSQPPRVATRPLPPPPLRPLPPQGIPLAPPPGPPPVPPVASGQPAPVALPEFVPDEVLVTVATAALPQVEADLAQAFGILIVERTPLPLIDARLVRLRIPDGRAVPAVVALIAVDPRVIAAQPNYLYARSQQPRPEAASGLAPAGLQYALAKLGAADLHRVTTGRGARVAVIDSGVDASHPDLAAARIAHFDATGAATATLDGHGTEVAGLIAAQGTVQGLAPGVELFSARVFRTSPWGVTATTETVLRGVTWSAEQGARVLNMSFAGPRDALVERHMRAVLDRGLIPIAAAGNNGARAAPAYPAAYPDVIAVTALDAEDRLYDRANQGNYIMISAPGVDVIVPTAGRSHKFESGTSFAAAHVTGVVALMLEIDAGLTPAQIRDVLMQTADDLGAVGRDPVFGAGRLNPPAALRLVTGAVAARP